MTPSIPFFFATPRAFKALAFFASATSISYKALLVPLALVIFASETSDLLSYSLESKSEFSVSLSLIHLDYLLLLPNFFPLCSITTDILQDSFAEMTFLYDSEILSATLASLGEGSIV